MVTHVVSQLGDPRLIVSGGNIYLAVLGAILVITSHQLYTNKYSQQTASSPVISRPTTSLVGISKDKLVSRVQKLNYSKL